MSRTLRIAIVEGSEIIRAGLVAILSRIGTGRVEIHEIADTSRLRDHPAWSRSEILIIDPAMVDGQSLQKIRKEWPAVRCAALMTGAASPAAARPYDAEISIWDEGAVVCEKIERLVAKPAEQTPREELSVREKEVVAAVVEGLTNKQIADRLNLSANTVISHRRNIAAKLGIHSTAGLAVYAIVNKLVDLSNQ